MNAKDLMIGDWVLSCGSEYHMAKADFAANYEFEPIPLTEKVLHKNGFKNDFIAEKSIIAEGASNFSVILISEDNRITINNIDEHLNSFNKWSIHINTEDMRTLCTAEITYIHELQHLLKLCKIEKEIVL